MFQEAEGYLAMLTVSFGARLVYLLWALWSMEAPLMPFIISLNPLSRAYGSLTGGKEQKSRLAAGAEQAAVVQVHFPKGV